MTDHMIPRELEIQLEYLRQAVADAVDARDRRLIRVAEADLRDEAHRLVRLTLRHRRALRAGVPP